MGLIHKLICARIIIRILCSLIFLVNHANYTLIILFVYFSYYAHLPFHGIPLYFNKYRSTFSQQHSVIYTTVCGNIFTNVQAGAVPPVILIRFSPDHFY